MASSSTSGGLNPTACCITGQLRGYVLARANRDQSTELQQLLGGDAKRVDWFLITSNSTSFQWYRSVSAPISTGFLGQYVSTGCQRYERLADVSWAWRDNDGKPEFNLNCFPHIHSDLHGTLLVQQWQLQKCRQMVLQQEQLRGQRYERVVRLRTDVVFGKDERGRRLWSSFVARLAEHQHWAMLHDWVLAGSRDAMIDVFLNGLVHLQKMHKLQGLQTIWQELRGLATKGFNYSIEIKYCNGVDGCRLDLVRAVGPPRSRFFVQVSEAQHAQRCVAQRLNATRCWNQYADLWHIRRMERAGYGFTYDWPPGHCADGSMHGSSIASCIAKAHVDAFSAEHIVGDPTWWNKIIKAPIPGYGWARRGRAPCDAYDGWR